MTGAPTPPLPAEIAAGLAAIGIELDGAAVAEPLAGGVSSDIWHVSSGAGEWCAKRALPTLRTAQRWDAPVERSAREADWLRAAATIAPDAVPRLIGYDDRTHTLALGYLPPQRFVNWKRDLLDGRVDPSVAARLGARLRALHDGMADGSYRRRFDRPDLIHALRLEPYLERTAARHPDLAPRFEGLVAHFHGAARTVVHGDVSPKNVLVGDGRVVLLDAECATWGDPWFDVAFCLTHLCAKAVHLPRRAAALRTTAEALLDAYAAAPGAPTDDGAPWLPALLLARVDGASPLEYLSAAEADTIRAVARDLLARPPSTLAGCLEGWFAMLDAGTPPQRRAVRARAPR